VVPTVLLIVGIICVVHVLNAAKPRRGRATLIPSFFMSWLTIELAPWWIFWQVVVAVVLVAAGGLESWQGWVGLVLVAFSTLGLHRIITTSRKSHLHLAEADEGISIDPDHSPQPFPHTKVLFPFWGLRHRAGVETQRNIPFGTGTTRKGKEVTLRLDLTSALDAKPGDKRPGVLQIHGGAWILGDKREQALPLVNHLAANGWVAINANYRLSPRVAAPEHLVDCKKAIAWWREHADEYGGDPDFLCVTGGSAGGHLTALVALTANDPRYQPGFEDVDTRVAAAVPFYGVYDFTNRGGHWHRDTLRLFIEPQVMQKKLADDPQAFADYSPMDQVGPDAPPFYVIHGELDTLAPVEDAREFVRLLREVSDAPVLYAEMSGAQHAFEIFPSHRAARVIESVERFLHSVHVAWRRGSGQPDEAEVATVVADGLDGVADVEEPADLLAD
jgi:acetyl esterase/lipase